MCNIEITQQDLQDLLEIFEKRAFEAGLCEEGSTEKNITKKCGDLFKSDYSLTELDNSNGALCPRYPSRIFIPESETNHSNMPSTSAAALNRIANPVVNGLANGIQAFVTFANTTNNLPQQQNTIYEDLFDTGKMRDLIGMAKYARCRQRFAVPVIMYKGKYICRSATISVMPETYGRKVVDFAYDCLNGGASTSAASTSSNAPSTSSSIDTCSSSTSSSTSSSSAMAISEEEMNDPTEESLLNNATEPSPFSYEEVIKSDIQLLKALNVSTIVDLMVEQRKVKYFMTVSSSEKADPENHYEEFNILSLPYPGCEFFKKFRDNNYMAKNLFFNWKQSFIDASLSIPINVPANDIDINWQDYKEWDLVQITQNYLKATIKCIQEENSGVLIHCISGWDRTPLFISLVRLSLWADGLIHQSLSPLQMTYLTVAYDWYLFGHQLPDRLRRSEDIMFFCFHVLKYITDDDFSAVEHRRRTKTTSSSGSSGVLVLRSDGGDDDAPKEDLNFEDSNDSNSNLSNCDMPITDNFYPASNNITSRSPNPKRSKTSPISVPEGNAARQRQESTSSIGSWQVVTDTGSLDSNTNSSYVSRPDASNNASSSTAAKDTKVAPSPRKQRLNAIRAIFITTYGKTIGLKFKEGSSMTLSSFIGTLADQFFT